MVTVVGAGRVGLALAAASAEVVLVGRPDGPDDRPLAPSGPILVAVRNDDVDAVVARVPEARRRDLTFVQNGMIRPHLEASGLGGCTRGLLFFAVPTRGAPITPGAPSPFTGPRAAEVVGVLQRAGVPAEEVGDAAFRALELEKLLWICVMGEVCDAADVTVGEAVERHHDAIEAAVARYRPAAEAALGASLPDAVARLDAYSRSIPDWRASVKERAWRNGWFDPS